MREQIQREQLQHHQQGMEAKLSALSSVGLNNCRADKVRTTNKVSLCFITDSSISVASFLLRTVDHDARSALLACRKLILKFEHGDFDKVLNS